ncbi:DUF6843 domain-containing protein [Alkalihalobacillus sp. CinArs1]|uniref:DUF6843 domain-containing protein n=1 Tax=Alkalihalobacillus sp. CinArs1 TaxID=2995314 RepID=UPI0022DD39C3|nr:hypothetical protein [Alkalihalobacillus sp. CinArs1]
MRWSKLLVLTLVVVSTVSCSSKASTNHDKTDTLHLIPEGFEGQLITVYNVEGAPKLKKEKGFTVIRYDKNGMFLTSTEEMEYGTVTDEFYYVDRKDKRTKIDENCTYLFPNGGITIKDRRLLYNAFYITETHCSEDFVGRGPQAPANRNLTPKLEAKLIEEGLME